jgi:DIS3-like exonuclease 2
LRFENGALALHSVKLTFDVDPVDGPLLASPYPIRDSNRLVEEYMLLANYLVAQRLITHAGDRACLRRHPPPLMDSMEKVSNLTKASLNYELSLETSEGLQRSLRHIGTICHDPLVLQCITQMMTVPMQQAIYFAAGTLNPSDWRHYALNSKLHSCMQAHRVRISPSAKQCRITPISQARFVGTQMSSCTDSSKQRWTGASTNTRCRRRK